MAGWTDVGKLEGRCSHETLHRGLPSVAVPLEINTSLYPDSPMSTAQVSTTDRLHAPPRHTGSSAQPPWGEWPQEFWDRSGAAQEQEEDATWAACLQAPQVYYTKTPNRLPNLRLIVCLIVCLI